MRKIIYTRQDGGLSVVTPIINTHPTRENVTEAEAEQRAWNKLPKDAINPRFVAVSEIPTDRTNRNCWRDTGTSIVVDPVPTAEVKQQEIVAVEQANPITHRAMRELILAIGAAYPQAQSTMFYQKALAADTAVWAIKDAP